MRICHFGCAQELSLDSPTALPYMTPSSPVDLDSRNGFLLEFKVIRNTVFSVKYAGRMWRRVRVREHAETILFQLYSNTCACALFGRDVYVRACMHACVLCLCACVPYRFFLQHPFQAHLHHFADLAVHAGDLCAGAGIDGHGPTGEVCTGPWRHLA
jgi:hypothetical protein